MLRAAGRSAGRTPADVPVQGVRVVGDGAAQVATYGDLVHLVGADAAAYALVRTRRSRPVGVDLDIWSGRDERNPLWRVAFVAYWSGELVRVDGHPPDPAAGIDDAEAVRLTAALDGLRDARDAAGSRGEPHRLADHLEHDVVPAHQAFTGLVHRYVSRLRDDPAGPDVAAYRSSLSLLTRCVDEVTAALALLGASLPARSEEASVGRKGPGAYGGERG
ncbi:MAG: hypothetical protein GEV10_21720 [Streptosporangiales bacterium]|nr:hypothetical protein [Streptosporangiales bacterium]